MPKYEDPVAEFRRRAAEIGYGWSIQFDRLRAYPYRVAIFGGGSHDFHGRGPTESEACQAALDRLDEVQGREE